MQAEEKQKTSHDEESNPVIKVTYRNYRTGLVAKKDPYILRVVGDGAGSKSQYLERPAGSGNLFDLQGKPIGRWDKTKSEGERFLKGATHVEWKKPETEDDKLAKTVVSANAKIAELEKELAAIKAESKKKEKGV